MFGLFLTSAQQSRGASIYSQGFETDTSGFTSGGQYGAISRVASGSNGITSLSGGFHAELTSTDSGPNTNFGGYSSVFPGTYQAQVSVYIDPAKLGPGGGFDYSVASNNQSGTHLRDYGFHVANDVSTGLVLLNVDNGSTFEVPTDLETRPGTISLTSVGWYTFRQTFTNNAGALSVYMEVLDPANTAVFGSTLSDPSDLIATVVGGNRYGWFETISTAQPLAIDNVSLGTVPEAGASLMLLGGMATVFVRRRRC